MWSFQIGTFSNRPLGNVLAKSQQWLVKSIEVNCSHCWGLRNQAVEAKILGKSGWTIAHMVSCWVEPYWWSLLMHGRRLKSGLFVCFVYVFVFRNELLTCSLRNQREIYERTVGISWVVILDISYQWYHLSLGNSMQKVLPGARCQWTQRLRSYPEYFEYLLNIHLWFKKTTTQPEWLWLVRTEVIKHVFVFGILCLWESPLSSVPHGNNNTSQNWVATLGLLKLVKLSTTNNIFSIHFSQSLASADSPELRNKL